MVQISPQLESKLELIVSKTMIVILLAISIVGVGIIGIYAKKNLDLNVAYQEEYKQFDIYTIPSNDLRLDMLNKNKILLQAFINDITQYMLTFTPNNYKKQQKTLKKFLAPNMLVAFNAKFYNQRDQANNQVFVPIGKPTIRTTGKRSINGNLVRNITIQGILKTVNSSRTRSKLIVKKLKIKMVIEKISISKTNPYGFILSKYQTEIINEDE